MLVSLVPRTLDTQLQTLAILDKVSSVDNGWDVINLFAYSQIRVYWSLEYNK